MADAGWEKFDEKNPFGKSTKFSTVGVVAGDNIPYSTVRRDAIIAMKNGVATPEQVALVQRTDEIYQEALALRD